MPLKLAVEHLHGTEFEQGEQKPLAMLSKLIRKSRSAVSRFDDVRAASSAGHKSVAKQLYEIFKLRLGPTKMANHEYHTLALFDETLYGGTDLSEFGGKWFKEWIHAQLNEIRWEGMVTDKLILYAIFSKLGLPHPEVFALYSKSPRRYGQFPVFDQPEGIAQFLRDSISYPFFCKPVKGSHAHGAHRVERYDSTSDLLTLSTGDTFSVEDFVARLDGPAQRGVLFQHAVKPHPDTIPLCGNAVSGCRVVMLLDDDGAFPFKVVWKIPVAGNYTDNFSGGSTGNLVSSVDIESGVVTRVVSGAGLSMRVNPLHPDTNHELVGYTLPEWDKIVEVATEACESFPGFRWQHWDIGITSEGPIIFELNSAGQIDIAQLAYGHGIYDQKLRDFIAKFGKGLAPRF